MKEFRKIPCCILWITREKPARITAADTWFLSHVNLCCGSIVIRDKVHLTCVSTSVSSLGINYTQV